MYSETEFQKFEEWLKNIDVDSYPYNRHHTRMEHAAIDFAITQGCAKSFFGKPNRSINGNIHNDFVIQEQSEYFIQSYEKWKSRQEKQWLKSGLKDPKFKAEYEQGCQDGYWLQAKKLSTEAYLYGYAEGLSLKGKQGYDVYETDTGCFAPGLVSR